MEYPLAMVLACVLVRPVAATRGRSGAARPAVPWSLPLGDRGLALVLYSETATLRVDSAFLARVFDPAPAPGSATWLDPVERLVNKALTYGVAAAARAPSCGAGRSHLGVALAGCSWWRASSTRARTTRSAGRRSFFGVLRDHARPRPQGLHGAAPRHHAARAAEP